VSDFNDCSCTQLTLFAY